MPLIRSRDLRVNIKDHGFERGVVMTLEAALDEMAELRQHMRELVPMVARVVDELDKLMHIGDAMQKSIQQMRREQRQGDEHGDAS